MKHFLFLTAMLVSATQAQEMIRHTQRGTGLIWDYYPSEQVGQMRSPLPAGAEGSVLSYYSSRATHGEGLILLEAVAVGKQAPIAALDIISEDPHVPARTRADRPFRISLKQPGLSRPLHIVRQGITYHPLQHAALASPAVAKQLGSWALPSTGENSALFYTDLPNADSTLAEGEETFAVFATAGKGQWDRVETARIQVWPVASARFTGLTSGETYTVKKLPAAAVVCTNLYPKSTTYVQIYPGKPRLGTLGAVLPISVVHYDSAVPQNQKILLGEWDDTLLDGQYTLELLTVTPFFQQKPERLAVISVTLDRGMHSPSLVKSDNAGK